MADTYAWSLSFVLDGTLDAVLVQTGTTPDGGPYADLTVAGTIGGSAITGFVTSLGVVHYDNEEGLGAGFTDGLGRNGIGLQLDNGSIVQLNAPEGTLEFGDNTGPIFSATVDAPVFITTAPCFLRGTRIAVPGGERPVELIAAGDVILTAARETRTVTWVGQLAYAGRLASANAAIQPVRFRAGSLGGGLPRRDLLVSPDHAMFLDGALVPAALLVNGISIVRERGMDLIRYHHIELDSHDVLLAEGAAAESFADDGSRPLFQNAGAAEPGTAAFCAPRLTAGERLEAIRRRLDVAGRLAT